MSLFESLGFGWDRTLVQKIVPTHSPERACVRFDEMMPEFVWDASVLEGNPLTLREVTAVLDGVIVGGRRLTDQEQILNLAQASKHLLTLVKSGQFALSKTVATEINALVARNESLEWGVFRGEGQETHYTPNVGLGEHGHYTPLPTMPHAPELNRVFTQAVQAVMQCEPLERALAFFLFGALGQFFFDGNKRTARFMMNGVLMTNGIDAISVPAAKAGEFNEAMVRFYLSKDATEMMAFLVSCHPDAQQMKTV